MNDLNLYDSLVLDREIPLVILSNEDVIKYRLFLAASGQESVLPEDEAPADEAAVVEPSTDEMPTAEAFAAPAAGGYSSGKFSGGQSFYVPWDISYLNQYKDYISKTIGAVVVVAIFCSAMYFGIQMLASFFENFKNRKG